MRESTGSAGPHCLWACLIDHEVLTAVHIHSSFCTNLLRWFQGVGPCKVESRQWKWKMMQVMLQTILMLLVCLVCWCLQRSKQVWRKGIGSCWGLLVPRGTLNVSCVRVSFISLSWHNYLNIAPGFAAQYHSSPAVPPSLPLAQSRHREASTWNHWWSLCWRGIGVLIVALFAFFEGFASDECCVCWRSILEVCTHLIKGPAASGDGGLYLAICEGCYSGCFFMAVGMAGLWSCETAGLGQLSEVTESSAAWCFRWQQHHGFSAEV